MFYFLRLNKYLDHCCKTKCDRSRENRHATLNPQFAQPYANQNGNAIVPEYFNIDRYVYFMY